MTDKKDGLMFEGEPQFICPDGMNTITIRRAGVDIDVPIRVALYTEEAEGGADYSQEFLASDLCAGEYIHMDAHLAAVRAARIEGYEIARKEAAECGWHLRRADLVEALNG